MVGGWGLGPGAWDRDPDLQSLPAGAPAGGLWKGNHGLETVPGGPGLLLLTHHENSVRAQPEGAAPETGGPHRSAEGEAGRETEAVSKQDSRSPGLVRAAALLVPTGRLW